MSNIQRRTVLQLAGAAGLAAALPHSQAADDLAAARAEGKAVFYANITAVKPIVEAFGCFGTAQGQRHFGALPLACRR